MPPIPHHLADLIPSNVSLNGPVESIFTKKAYADHLFKLAENTLNSSHFQEAKELCQHCVSQERFDEFFNMFQEHAKNQTEFIKAMTPSGWKVFAQNIGGALGVITAAGIVIGIPMFVVVKTKFFNEMNIFSKGNEEPELETGQKLAEEAKGSPMAIMILYLLKTYYAAKGEKEPAARIQLIAEFIKGKVSEEDKQNIKQKGRAEPVEEDNEQHSNIDSPISERGAESMTSSFAGPSRHPRGNGRNGGNGHHGIELGKLTKRTTAASGGSEGNSGGGDSSQQADGGSANQGPS